MSRYKVGDPDPTPDSVLMAEACLAEKQEDDPRQPWTYTCTWPLTRHPDQHVAGGGGKVWAVWPVA